MKWRFAVKFLLAFTVLLTLWSWTNFAHFYRNAVLTTVQQVSPVVNGWWLQFDKPNPVGDVVFRFGNRELAMLVQLPALSMGLVPLLSLIVATPGLRARQTALRGLIGAVLYFLTDVIVVLRQQRAQRVAIAKSRHAGRNLDGSSGRRRPARACVHN